MNNRHCFWARVFAIMSTKGEAFKLADEIFVKMKKDGLTKAWSLSEMTDEEFGVAYNFTNLIRENGHYKLPKL